MDLALVFSGCHRRGGVERSVYEAARQFRGRHSVTVYACEFESAGLEGVRQVRLPSPPRQSWARPLTFARHARNALEGSTHDHVISFGVGDVGADVLWVNSVHRAWLQAACRLPHRGWRSPRLRYVMPRHRILLQMERHYFTRSKPQLAVVVADAVGEDLNRLYGVPAALLRTIHNGFEPEEFSLAKREAGRTVARAARGFTSDDLVLLMAANELDRKGFPIVLEAMAILNNPHLRLLLAGRADPAGYAGRIAELGLTERVSWAGSIDMASAHAAADAFVLPTQYEAFCLAIVEALASGLPVVTSGVPGAGDLISHGTNGLVVRDPTDAREVAEHLARLTEEPSRSRMSNAAASSVSDLTWESLFLQAEQMLISLPSRSAG